LSRFDFSWVHWNHDALELKSQPQKGVVSKIKTIAKNEIKKGRTLSAKDVVGNLPKFMNHGYYHHIQHRLNHPSLVNKNVEYPCFYFFTRMFCYSSMFRFNGNDEINALYEGISNNNQLSDKIKYMKLRPVFEGL